MVKTQRVLLVPEDTHYEYPEEVSASTTAKKFAHLTYAQLIYCLDPKSSKHEFQKYAAQELGKRSYTDPEGCEQIYQEAGITDLVDLLRPEMSLMLRYISATALINIALDAQSRVDISVAGGVSLLVDLLSVTHPKTLEHAIWCLVNITKDRQMCQDVIEAGVFGKLSRLLNPPDQKLKVQNEKLLQDAGLRQRTAMLLCNLVADAPSHQLQDFRKAGLLVPLLRWLVKYKADDEMTRLMLASIYHVILDVDNRNDFIKIKGLSLVAKMLFVADKSHHLYIMLKIFETLSLNQECHEELLNTSVTSGPLKINIVVTLLSLMDSVPHLLISATALLANLSNSQLCREQIVSSNGVLLMCRLLNHEIEAVAASACIVVTNLAKEDNVRQGISSISFVPAALLRLTFSENRTETQALGLAGLKNFLSFQSFSLKFLAEGGAERLWKMGKMVHNANIHALAITCITTLIFAHPPSSSFPLPPSLASDALVICYDALPPQEVDLHIKYMAMLGIKTLLVEGVDSPWGKIEKVEGEVGRLEGLEDEGKLTEEIVRIAKDLLELFADYKARNPNPSPALMSSASFANSFTATASFDLSSSQSLDSSLEPSAVPASTDFLPPLDPNIFTLPPLSAEPTADPHIEKEEEAETPNLTESLDSPAAEAATPSGGAKITMKVSHEKVVKMMKVDASSTLSDLQKVLGQKFSVEVSLVQYKDDDGDLICLETEDDMEFFIDTFNEKPKKKYEVFIEGPKINQGGGGPPPPVAAGGPPPPPAAGAPPPPPPPGPPPPPDAFKPKPVKLNIPKKSGSSAAPKPKVSSGGGFQDELRARLQKGVVLKKVEQQAPKRREVRRKAGGQQDMMSQLMNVLDERRSKVKDDDQDATTDDWED